MKAVKQYLSLYREEEASLLRGLSFKPVQHCLIIPAFDETAVFFDKLQHLFNQHAVLLILVINQPDTINKPTEKNQLLLSAIQQKTQLIWQNQHLQMRHILSSQSQVLIVDRFNQGEKIPHKQGVGLARKIAADIAAQLIDQQLIVSPWIYSTDCDATLPKDYFAIGSNKQCSAFTYPFKHLTDNSALGQATQLYDYSLRYYRAGLEYAGSPYSFYTIGSCLAVHATAYCQARGFPKRSGGEDFYLLNKLAKIGQVKSLEKPIITIKARTSHRVPFGTGPAVQTIIDLENPAEEYRLYNPEIFEHLKLFINQFESCFNNKAQLNELAEPVKEIALDMGFEEAVKQANKLTQRSQNPQQFLRHVHSWFDGFRTLKFVHSLRDSKLDNISFAKLNQQQTPWIPAKPKL